MPISLLSSGIPPRLLEAAGARDQPAFAGEPSADIGKYSALGPASAEAAADILFTNTAAGAVLADDTLKLTGVTGVTLYSTSGRAAGVYRTGTSIPFVVSSSGCVCLLQRALLCWDTLLGRLASRRSLQQ